MRVALGVVVVVVLLLLLLGLIQLLLPMLAAKRVSDRVARYGTIRSASVSAWPALELLWGKADSVTVHAGSLTVTPAQIASLLSEAQGVSRMSVTADAATLRVTGLPNGLTVSGVVMEKHGTTVHARATLTQQQLNEALGGSFHAEPVASGDGQVEAKVSGGFFGVQASIAALVKPLEGRLVAEPQGFPLASLATVTLFSDAHLKVESVGVAVHSRQPLIYGLSLRASLR